jgi:tRNA threonylcarbamoyladenosine biosynthesis protein TsaB
MKLLALDTATEMLSVAVSIDSVVRERSLHAGQRHGELVLQEIDALLASCGVRLADLDGIAYGAGPGSFTGLRIACGVVQGLAAARGLCVLGIGTLAAIAQAAGDESVIACLDARMGEVYHAAFERRGGSVHEVIPPGLHRPHAIPIPDGNHWIGCGSGFAAYADALRARCGTTVVRFRPEVFPSAAAILRLAMPRFSAGEGDDAATTAPIYLRDRVALKTAER